MDEVDFWLKRTDRMNKLSKLLNSPAVRHGSPLRFRRLIYLHRAYDDYCWKNSPIQIERYVN